MSSRGHQRSPIVSGPKRSPNGNPLPGDKRIEYTIRSQRDPHAHPAARRILDQDFIETRSVHSDRSKISFSLREYIDVELSGTEADQGHHCSCGDYSPNSPCSHVYWVWDQVIRVATTGVPLSSLPVRLVNEEGQVMVGVGGGDESLDAVAVVNRYGKQRVQELMEWRTDPRLDGEQKLKDFITEFQTIRSEAERSFLSISEPIDLNLPSIGIETYREEIGNRHLQNFAKSLLDTYNELKSWLRYSRANLEYQSAIDAAVLAAIVMMRGILLRSDLRRLSMGDFDNEEPDNFWAIINEFFESVGRAPISDLCIDALFDLMSYILQGRGSEAERLVASNINAWYTTKRRGG